MSWTHVPKVELPEDILELIAERDQLRAQRDALIDLINRFICEKDTDGEVKAYDALVLLVQKIEGE